MCSENHRLLYELSKSNSGKGNSVRRTATMDNTIAPCCLQFFTFLSFIWYFEKLRNTLLFNKLSAYPG